MLARPLIYWTLLLAFGCKDEPTFHSFGRVAEVRSDAVVFEIETRPGASVTHHRSGRTATADAAGVARVEVPPDEAVDRASHTGELTVFIPSTTFLRGDQRTNVSILVGFDPTPLASVPDAETRSWVLGFGALESENAFLLRLLDYQGESPQLGRVLVPPTGGVRWVGPPGTMLTLGQWTFTIPEAGELRWTPTDAELLALWRPEATSGEVDVVVSTPGRPTERGRITVSMEAAAEARIGAYLRAVGARETPRPRSWSPTRPRLPSRSSSASMTRSCSRMRAVCRCRRIFVSRASRSSRSKKK